MNCADTSVYFPVKVGWQQKVVLRVIKSQVRDWASQMLLSCLLDTNE